MDTPQVLDHVFQAHAWIGTLLGVVCYTLPRTLGVHFSFTDGTTSRGIEAVLTQCTLHCTM